MCAEQIFLYYTSDTLIATWNLHEYLQSEFITYVNGHYRYIEILIHNYFLRFVRPAASKI